MQLMHPSVDQHVYFSKDAGLTAFEAHWIAEGRYTFVVPDEIMSSIAQTRAFIDDVAAGREPVYGVNTGFGALAERRVDKTEVGALQKNLIRSHAVGVGEPLSPHLARLVMLLRLNTLCHGGSGVRPIVLSTLATLLASKAAPYIPAKGSVGASGDLAPLAHLALLLMGEGNAYWDGQKLPAVEVLKRTGVEPLVLEAKEGLALINGTQAMTALGLNAIVQCTHLLNYADVIAAMSIDALLGSATPFDERIHLARPHPGQKTVAANMRLLLKGSALIESHAGCHKVQDPYSLRCVPQVHGAVRDVIANNTRTLHYEVMSMTDNPLVFALENGHYDILSGGNFHGEPVAFALDFMAIAMAEIANISERRIEHMLNPALSSGLPAFLSPNPGLNSGLMMLQVTAASLVNENKILCHPASTDSIPSSANREDHVSMGMTSANKLMRVLENVQTVLAIEWVCAAQAIDLRASKTSPSLYAMQQWLRSRVDLFNDDRHFGNDLNQAIELLKHHVWNVPADIGAILMQLSQE